MTNLEENRYVIILAAGKGTRMKSKLYKVLHPVAGKPMVEHIVDQVEQTKPTEIVTIVGHGAEAIKEYLGERTKYALQQEQQGTGHAVMQAESLLKGKKGTTLVITGDTPLLTAETLTNLFDYHQGKNASATILTAQADDPTGYGRIIRDHLGIVEKIVEQKDASEEETSVREINTGTFCFDNEALFSSLSKIEKNNSQGEYYLTDIIEILKNGRATIAAYRMADFDEAMGINDRMALATANKIMYKRLNAMHMMNGVTFVDPASTYIDEGVVIGSDTVIEAGVCIKGKTVIGEDCFISSGSEIVDSVIEDNVKIVHSVIEKSTIRSHADVGPFAHLRPNTEIGSRAHIGNFVEIKNSSVGEETKIGHLSYVGDADLGKDINVGCGVIFVNYDGKDKQHISVGDHTFIGSGSNLIAPLTIENNVMIAAGSTITDDVYTHDLAIARARQVNKKGYAENFSYFEGKE
ncbi:bifunctional UDP-N-acetylglucosamine diphosphorylase/glucosamine-1-phosphate N-acetyltransferase GlmU [Enterococcus sp. CWB-B31]|nr:bifunctional UDP-N-acetylglucosamine diphosphorylase/glucosamine-1-phosphate N-acetyltransferase GlmU [Enterococcus sp. CWB-B31]MCB5956089.1 bifunctional UDP-N-acetylglucosamine diphosphorylase/glucosamine-1-phosphate N-acetyltransferase GlmU [Enterococcus sp. CWB-B31]